ncbi:MAG: hypothetical protein OEX05_11210, partial [Chloroflexota bacterium]|nr:hypothetical protein [Chloroflexota bacterium]
TVRNWQRADPDFSVACAKAEAEAQISFIAQLAKQSNEGSTQATIHWLKCRCPSMREPKDQPVAIASSGEGLQGMLSMMTELARKVAAGEVAPSMLADMATVVEKASAVFERTDLETRIAALEAKR